MSDPTPPDLSPVSPDVLAQMEETYGIFLGLTEQLARLEMDKPRLLVALNRADEAYQSILKKLRKERQIPADVNFEVDPKSGAIKLV